MKRATGILYLATGFISDFGNLLLEARHLERVTPDYSMSALVSNIVLWRIGPALLILTGVVSLVENTRRRILCVITGIVIISGVALRGAPILGWPTAIRLLVVPYSVGFLIASPFILYIKRRWVLALTGSVLSARIATVGIVTPLFAWAYTAGAGPWTFRDIWPVIPAVFIIASFICSMTVRTA